MIEVEKMEPADEKKEVLQYLKDHQDTLIELAKCDKCEAPEDFNSMIKNVSIALIMDDVENFRNTEGLSDMKKFVKNLVYVIAGCDKWPFLNTFGYRFSTPTGIVYRYDKKFDAIVITSPAPFESLSKMVPVDTIKNNIHEALQDLDDVSWEGIYLEIVGAIYNNIPNPSSTGFCGNQLYAQYYPPMPYPAQYAGAAPIPYPAQYAGAGYWSPIQHHDPTKKIERPKRRCNCSHYYQDGRHALYKNRPSNKSWKCNLCGRTIQSELAKKIIQASTIKSEPDDV